MEFETRHFSSVMENKYSVSTKMDEGVTCFRCGFPINERYLLCTNNQFWHSQCFRCFVCQATLEAHKSCFFKGGNIYCQSHYQREFGTKCYKCQRLIESTDWIHRVHHQVYHLACFSCVVCKKQLSKGDEYVLKESEVICTQHSIEIFQGGPHKDSENEQRRKRLRTNFSVDQTLILQGNFALNRNPDGNELEHISQITGLSKRVVQVWYQNARAKQRKHQQQEDSSPESMTTATRQSPCQWDSTYESQDSSK